MIAISTAEAHYVTIAQRVFPKTKRDTAQSARPQFTAAENGKHIFAFVMTVIFLCLTSHALFFNSQVANWKEHKPVCGALGKGAKIVKKNVISEL